MLIWCHIASSRPRPLPPFAYGEEPTPAIPASTGPALPAVPRSNACRTPSRYSFRFRSSVATLRSLLVGRYPSRICQDMARTSEGRPDHAEFLSSASEIEEACRILLNLLMRVIRAECASRFLDVALAGTGAWLMRCREFAGSRRMSLYCGRRILPSVVLLAEGYVGMARASATSPLSNAHAASVLVAWFPFCRLGRLEPPGSLPFLFDNRLPFLRVEAMLGSPNSSSSSS